MAHMVSKVLAGAALIGFLSACTPTPQPPLADREMQAAALSMMEPWMTDNEPGVAVAISHNGEIIFAEAGGLANMEHDQALQPGSVFQAASVSKQFTAFAVLMLVVDDRINLDDDVRDYIPELTETPAPVTVAHLLDHMGGLREHSTISAMAGWLDDDIRTHKQLMRLNTQQKGVNFIAGTEVEYSNTGYALLAETVARISGQSFQDFTQSQIFTPLGMTQTRFTSSRGALISGRAASYYPSEAGFMNIVAANELYGSTGLYTTVLDLLKWAENFETRQVGGDQVFELMAQRVQAENGDDSTFAKGQEHRIYNGLETWSHGGRDAGYRSFLMRVPSENFALSIASNRTDFDTAKMAFGLIDVFLKNASGYMLTPTQEWNAATAQELAAFSGDYVMYPGVILSIQADDDSLKFAELGTPIDDFELLPQIAARQFALNPDATLSITFNVPENGKSPGFGYNIGLHGTLQAERIVLSPFDSASVDLTDYIGVYASLELGTEYEIEVKDGQLIARHYRIADFPLTPYQTDRFIGKGPLQELVFKRDEIGQVIGMQASASLAEGVIFTRKPPGD